MKLNKLVFKFVSVSFSILMLLLIVVGMVELGSFCYEFGYRVFTETPMEEEPGRDVVVQVTSGMSESDIGQMLKEEGLIRDGKLFFAQLKLSAYAGKLQPGTYTLNTSMTGRDMIVAMAAEKTEDTESAEADAKESTPQTQVTETETAVPEEADETRKE